jgi:DNA-binding XRE family transcriptional regulator
MPYAGVMKGSSDFFVSGLTEGMETRLARVALRLTQWQVANKAGVAQWAVSAYERGERYVPPAWVRRIREALGLEVPDD